jgi:hypothetical protein
LATRQIAYLKKSFVLAAIVPCGLAPPSAKLKEFLFFWRLSDRFYKMFPAPPFSMFRYASWQVHQAPGSVHVPHSWCSDPQMDSDDVYEYLLEEPGLFMNKSNIVSSFSTDEPSIMEPSFLQQVSNN